MHRRSWTRHFIDRGGVLLLSCIDCRRIWRRQIYAPTITNDRIAGFAKLVIEAAKANDEVARGIIKEPEGSWGIAAAAVIRSLKMEQEHFQVPTSEACFTAGDWCLSRLEMSSGRGPKGLPCAAAL